MTSLWKQEDKMIRQLFHWFVSMDWYPKNVNELLTYKKISIYKRTRLFILPWVPIYSPRPFFLTTLEHELWIYFTFSNFPSKGKACDIFEYYIMQDVPTSNTDCQQNTELFNMKPTAVTAPSTQLSGEVSYILVSYSIGLFTSINLKLQS